MVEDLLTRKKEKTWFFNTEIRIIEVGKQYFIYLHNFSKIFGV